MSEPGMTHISLRTALILVVFTVAFTALMALIYLATKAPISQSAEEEKLKLIGAVLPPGSYDNALLQDSIDIPPTAELGLNQASRIYRARKGGVPVALVLEAAAPDGYSGRIGLIIGLRVVPGIGLSPSAPPQPLDIIAVRVTEHRETPGLGDYIDPKKDKNKVKPWISQFDAISFAKITPDQWQVKKDGGQFEQRAGATISARAVTRAVGRALQWADTHQALLLQPPPSR